MALVTEKPHDIPSGNDLDAIPDDVFETPPAYLRFGTSPAALEDPPEVGDVRTYIVRARCTEEHGPIERKDGEMRYVRTLAIQACWESGKQPPATDGDQPGLFDAAGNPESFDDDGQDEADADDDLNEFDPEFSHNGDPK